MSAAQRPPEQNLTPGTHTAGKPVILITGSSGIIGAALMDTLSARYSVIGLDVHPRLSRHAEYPFDITSDDSIALALYKIREKHGPHFAAVIHLAAYFDFTGENNPLYKSVNEEGTRRLLQHLQDFKVERFIYASTMLVHRVCKPGQQITESTPCAPRWAYPRSKLKTEEIIEEEHGRIPYTLLRLAGLYSEKTAVPTLSQQIARIYERELKAHLYAGSTKTGQAFIHEDDAVRAFEKTIERRHDLPHKGAILIGEDHTVSYEALQDEIGRLVHGQKNWKTISFPKKIAKTGAWLEEKAEPLIPDDFDQGEKPFIRPFMVDMADDHYALDTAKARDLLGWEAQRHILDTLPALIESLKKDPLGWYKANNITPPDWLHESHINAEHPEHLRVVSETHTRQAHQNFLWAHFLNMFMGCWLIASPATLSYESQALIWSDLLSGTAVLILSFLTLSWQWSIIRWVVAALGLWVMTAPLIFWAPTAAAYLNGTAAGALIMGFAILSRPPPGVSPVAAETGPTIPPGWDFCPSSWFQRLPIIILAVIGFFISRYMCAYQLGHIDSVWEPFFIGAHPEDLKNGTEEIITSSVSEAWPVPDAGLGSLTYMLEILTGIIGSSRRWRTMPWLVLAFGIMIVPLGVVSITFIIIQPIILSTWCTLCLIAAAAMLIQIPYSFDELVATCQFLWRRHKKGRPLLRVFFQGDTDDGAWNAGIEGDDFEQPPPAIIREMLTGGITLPWTLVATIVIGLWLMFTRLSLETTGGMADADHLIGALLVTNSIIALAEVARPMRWFNLLLGAALLFTPFLYGVDLYATSASLICGALVIVFTPYRGPVLNTYKLYAKQGQ